MTPLSPEPVPKKSAAHCFLKTPGSLLAPNWGNSDWPSSFQVMAGTIASTRWS